MVSVRHAQGNFYFYIVYFIVLYSIFFDNIIMKATIIPIVHVFIYNIYC